MNKWFHIAQIDADTFAICENQHWEEPNCYLLLGYEQALLIDTGLGVANINNVVDQLTNLPVFVTTTHAHWDHIGGHHSFQNIAVHKAEVDWLSSRFPLPLDIVKTNLTCKPCKFPTEFDLSTYTIFQGMPSRILKDGDIFDLGGRKVTVIHTPGHSPGHCCFYEPERKYLYSGDLIYSGCLDAFYPSTDPQLFFQSISNVCTMDIHRILPGHHRLDIPTDLAARIADGFRSLDHAGKLQQGQGIFDFGDFQIHI